MNYNGNNPAEYYKNRIEKLSRYNEEELFRYFKAADLGFMVMSYPASLEQEIYSYFSIILKRKYPDYCDEKDIKETLSKYGHIYTAKLNPKHGEAIYQLNSANILMYDFMDRLDDALLHELLHKLGYLRFNDDFYKMPQIYIEAGTELVTNTILERPQCRELVLGSMWTRSIGVQPAYLLETSLVNQFNMICKGSPLERGIIDGRNYLEDEIRELVGEEKYLVLFEELKEICRLEKEFWKSGRSKRVQTDIENRISDFQNDLLKTGFDRKSEEIEDANSAETFLKELMDYSDYRIKHYKNDSYVDEFFDEYFEAKKEFFETKFGKKFNIENIQDTWKNRFPTVLLDKEAIKRKEENKKKIDEMARKKKQEGSIISRLGNIFGKSNSEKKLDVPKEKTSNELWTVNVPAIKIVQSNGEKPTERRKEEK